MIGCCCKFIQSKKTVIFKALRVILAQVKSYHFVKSLSSFAFGLFPGFLVQLSLQSLATWPHVNSMSTFNVIDFPIDCALQNHVASQT